MAKVVRKVIARGECHVVECAVRRDGSSPAKDFLDDLGRGMWMDDPDEPNLPADAQVRDRDMFLSMCQLLAIDGVPVHGRAVNYLTDGIWEFKRGSKRMTFYDTDGAGNYVPKSRITSIREADHADDYWWFPEFNRRIRLGHCFPKTGWKAESFDLREADAVRLEDLEHDAI